MSSDMVWVESIESLEQQLRAAQTTLANLREPSRTPTPGALITPPTERGLAQSAISTASGRIASRRKLIYEYALGVHYELKYSGIAEDIFVRLRDRVDRLIADIVPGAVQKLTSVYENLQSTNSEDWANAVHSCRRILQDLADALSPASDEVETVLVDGKERTIRFGPDQYINRLVRFINANAGSGRFQALVGSHLGFMGDRLDAVFQAAQKGSHASVTKEEADRYVVYTYLLLGDILSLTER